MTTPSIIKYPLDVTGLAPTNRIVGEELSVPRGPRSRAFALKAGPFFANSVVVRDAATNTPLTPVDDYKLLYELEDATVRVGQSIRAVLWVHNEAVFGNLLVDYQVVGAEYSSHAPVIAMLIETLQLDDRAVEWDDVLYKPVYYPPAPHLHHVRDWYGFDDVIAALDRITAVLGAGGAAVDLSAIYQRLDQIDFEMDSYGPAITLLNNTVAQLLTTVSNQTANRLQVNRLTEDGELLAGRVNLFDVTCTGSLPDTTNLPVNTVVELCRSANPIAPIVSVKDPNLESIRFGAKQGAFFNYKTKRSLTVVLKANKVWEVSL